MIIFISMFTIIVKSVSNTGCLKKQNSVEKMQYFTNGAIYKCNNLSHGNGNFCLGVCKVSIQYVKNK